MHILGGHKNGVLDIAIHPSGKIALTVSKDDTMKLWNLIEGISIASEVAFEVDSSG